MTQGSHISLSAILSPEFSMYSGIAVDPNYGIAAGIWGTANLIVYYPFQVYSNYTVANYWIVQNTAGVATTARMGIYNAALSKLSETNGTIDLTTAGTNILRAKAPSSTLAITPGVQYYLALTVNTGGAWTGNTTGASQGPTFFNLSGIRQEAGAGTLPSTATMANNAQADIWHCGISSSTTIPVPTP